MIIRPTAGWVVYRHPAEGNSPGVMGVCPAAEWRSLDAARPGELTLVLDNILSEGLAERLARGTTGDTVPRANAAPTATRWGAAGRAAKTAGAIDAPTPAATGPTG